jgi:C-terminal processing protease CtpA/Prc
MKHLMLVCLLAMSAEVAAQAPSATTTSADDAKREAEDARTRAKLDEARARLDKAAQEVAELSMQLGRDAMGGEEGIRTTIRNRRAGLGVQIDNASDKAGVRVMQVSPGGPAAEAGLRDGDVIISLDGKSFAGNSSAAPALVEQMRAVKPDQKVKVRVIRDGKNKDFVVVARPMNFDRQVFTMRTPEMGGHMVGGFGNMGPMPMVRHFGGFLAGEFGGMELASLTPKLGAYFGTGEGVLVVQAPEKNDVFKLEDGDVIQSIDGRKPDDGAHAMRILRSYRSGEKVNLSVLRQRKPLTLDITMPERPAFGGGNFHFESPMPPMPAMPAMPATPANPPSPGVPGGAGTLE